MADAKMTVTMKVVKNLFILVALGLVFSVQAATITPVADDRPIIRVEAGEDEQTLVLHLANLLEASTKVTLRDMQGTTLFTESIEDQSAYAKALNLRVLPEGRYVLHVETDVREIMQPLVIKYGAVTILEKEAKEIKKPVINFVDNMLSVTAAPNQLDKNDLFVTIMDKTNEELYKTQQRLYHKVEKRFDLSNMAAGNYIVKVTAADRSYFHNIEVE